MPSQPRLMSPAEIQRALRLISTARGNSRGSLLTRLAEATGLNRTSIYLALEGTVPPRVQQLLSAAIPDVLGGQPWTR